MNIFHLILILNRYHLVKNYNSDYQTGNTFTQMHIRFMRSLWMHESQKETARGLRRWFIDTRSQTWWGMFDPGPTGWKERNISYKVFSDLHTDAMALACASPISKWINEIQWNRKKYQLSSLKLLTNFPLWKLMVNGQSISCLLSTNWFSGS